MYEIGSEFHFEKNNVRENLIEVFEHAAVKSGRNIAFLRCGRDAIGFVADDIIAKLEDAGKDGLSKKVFLPALSCDSMVRPFEVRGFDVSFYKLKEDLTVDTDYLLDRIGSIYEGAELVNPTILFMNFYGIADTLGALKAVKEKCPGAVTIEDVTHIILEPEEYLEGEKVSYVDYHVGSIRKWLGVPDGAIAISKDEFVMGALTGDTDFSLLRMEALKEKTQYLDNGDQELKAHFRKLLSDAEDSLSDGLDPYHMSDESAEYLKSVDALYISEKRSMNYHNLYNMLKALPLYGKAFSLLKEEDYEKFTPFMLPIVLDIDFMRRSAITEEGKTITRDGFEKLLAAKGVYAPVLWPISDEAAATCPVSKSFADKMLAFWIDQRYNRFDMERSCEVLDECLAQI